ncbi:MAG: type II toxin-antitoxin system MqsA family antitoxin, partial [Betaproteobacteria bacterium]|nr:type II toxin-antitoxin system MqsA family antitoxin [Betaproteobacteria bacterium]
MTKTTTPQRIRHIRKSLGWTQAQAGAEMGVAAAAFQKYESGKVKPSKAACRLLEILYQQHKIQIACQAPESLRVSHREINLLSPEDLSDLLARLLQEEIRQNHLPPDCLHQRGHINAADGGIDAHIRWSGEPGQTAVLPSGNTAFQVKAGSMPPTKCAKELIDGSGDIKQSIRQVLAQGGDYVLFCSQQASEAMVKDRLARMHACLASAKPAISVDAHQRCHFWDGQKIAAWANRYAVVCAWIGRKLGKQHESIFTDLQHVAGKHQHAGQYCQDPRAAGFTNELFSALAEPKAVVRITGAPGIGKSRLLLETLMSSGKYRNAVYADVGSRPDAIAQVDHFCRTEPAALLVIDNCEAALISKLTNLARHEASAVKMIVIDNDPGFKLAGVARIELAKADASLIEKILQENCNGVRLNMPSCVKAAAGFPSMARLIASSQWQEPYQIVDSSTCYQMLGKDDSDLQSTARLLAVFKNVGFAGDCASELAFLAGLNENLNEDKMREHINYLIERKIVRKAGNRVMLVVPPLARMLAEQQWRIWKPDKLAELLMNDLLPRHGQLRHEMSEQFELLAGKSDFARHMEHLLAAARGNSFLSSCDDDCIARLIFKFNPKELLELFSNKLNGNIEQLLTQHRRAQATIEWLAKIADSDASCFAAAGKLLFGIAVAAHNHDHDHEFNEQATENFADL